MKARALKEKKNTLYTDNRVQLLLGKFFNGELDSISPVLDPEYGVRYPAVEAFFKDPKEIDAFLISLENMNLFKKKTCGYMAYCEECGSSNIHMDIEGVPSTSWRCGGCGTPIPSDIPPLKPVFCYQLSQEGVGRVSDYLIVKPILEFLRERGYVTNSPGFLKGDSNVEHPFDVIAYNEEEKDTVLAIDFNISDEEVKKDFVISMFAKVYDTNPQRALLIVFPGLSSEAMRLAKQYDLEVVETQDLENLWKDLLQIIPTVDDFKRETLDVMTLLSLPDHLRKTASVVCEKGRATADEISGITERARAVESGYLNQLVRMGYLRKEREGRKVLFSVTS